MATTPAIQNWALCDKPISGDVTFISWVPYEPNLLGYRVMVRNWYEQQLQHHESTHFVPEPDNFAHFCERFLATLLHVFLNEEYKMIGLQTDSPRKLLTCLQADGGVYPRYLIDLVREVARPMVSGQTVYIPCLPLDYDGNGPVAGTGLSPAFSNYFVDFVEADLLRPVVVERLLPAPLVAFVGESGVMAYSNEVASWRYNACLALRHLQNGARGFNAVNPPAYRKTFPAPPRMPLPALRVRNPGSRWRIWDRWTPSPPIDVSEVPGNEVALLSGLQTSPLVQHVRLNRLTVVLHYENSVASTNAWAVRMRAARAAAPAIPAIVDIAEVHMYGVTYGTRFPTHEYHSMSPKTTGAPQQTRRFPRKARAPQKGSKSEVPPP